MVYLLLRIKKAVFRFFGVSHYDFFTIFYSNHRRRCYLATLNPHPHTEIKCVRTVFFGIIFRTSAKQDFRIPFPHYV